MTALMNGDTGEILHLAEGKKKTSLESFFQRLSPRQIKKIKAVGVGRAGISMAVAEKYTPTAQIVYDNFYVATNRNTAVDEVRRNEWRTANKDEKRFIKGQRFNRLRNEQYLKGNQCDRLAELFEANESLLQAYLLEDAFSTLWTSVRPKWASTFLANCIQWAGKTE